MKVSITLSFGFFVFVVKNANIQLRKSSTIPMEYNTIDCGRRGN